MDYWVTFRIHSDNSYQQRYDKLIEALVKARTGSWVEPTSFWLVSSDLDIDQFTAMLAAALRSTTDLLVTRELERDNSRYFGKVEHLEVFKSFLPNIKKIG